MGNTQPQTIIFETKQFIETNWVSITHDHLTDLGCGVKIYGYYQMQYMPVTNISKNPEKIKGIIVERFIKTRAMNFSPRHYTNTEFKKNKTFWEKLNEPCAWDPRIAGIVYGEDYNNEDPVIEFNNQGKEQTTVFKLCKEKLSVVIPRTNWKDRDFNKLTFN